MNDGAASSVPKRKGLLVAVAFLVPPVGIIWGLTARRREDAAGKEFAAKVLAAAIFGLFVLVVLYVIWFAVLGAAGLLK